MEPLRPPLHLPRSGLACWFSLVHLIRTRSPCYLWTITAPDVIPDSWFGRAFRKFILEIHHAQEKGFFRQDWGGVRVYEVHEKRAGGGLHVHWVVRGYMDYWTVRKASDWAGFGRIDVNPKPVTPRVCYYLANYLTKNGKIRGVRQWGNIGTYDGIGKRDIIVESPRIDRIKALQAFHRSEGKHRFTAYRLAVQEVEEQDASHGEVPF